MARSHRAGSCNVRCRCVSFFCEVAASEGGETPLFDMRAVYASLPPRLQRFLVDARIQVQGKRRTYGRDDWLLCLGATDEMGARAAVERQGMTAVKLPSGELEVRGQTPAVVEHPQGGGPCLTDHIDVAQTWWWNVHVAPLPGSHASCLTSPRSRTSLRVLWRWLLAGACALCRRVRVPLLERAIFVCYRVWLYYKIGATEVESTQIKRGAVPLSFSDRVRINEEMRRHCTLFTWRAGDVLLLDNIRVGHARLDYRGPRTMWTMLCGTYDARSLQTKSLQLEGE